MARLGALFAAVLSLAVAPVQAVSFSSASLSNFTITLFDLNPADGITSGITFAEPYTGDFASVFASSGGVLRSSSATGTGPFDLTVGDAASSVRAAVTGTGPINVTSLTTSGSAIGMPPPGGTSFYSASAYAPSSSNFTVTANTLVSFSALANVDATNTLDFQGGEFESASALAILSAEGAGPGGGGLQFSSENLSALVVGAGSSKNADLLTVSFANLTGSNMVGVLDRAVFANGFSPVVPEAETYAMMLAGLGLLAFMLRCKGRLPHA